MEREVRSIIFTRCWTKEIEKLATGGNRNINIHFGSIEVNPNVSISGEVILVVDDVTTSGNSLYACRDILLKHDASRGSNAGIGADGGLCQKI